MLGRFNAQAIIDSVTFFGPAIFVIFNVLFVFILLGMFITILMNAFDETRGMPKGNVNGRDLYEYVMVHLRRWFFESLRGSREKKAEELKEKYMSDFEVFDLKVDQLCKVVEIFAKDNRTTKIF